MTKTRETISLPSNSLKRVSDYKSTALLKEIQTFPDHIIGRDLIRADIELLWQFSQRLVSFGCG